MSEFPKFHSLADLNLDLKKFHNREDIKPYLSERLWKNKGIKVVIERSDYHKKIIFKCQNGRESTSEGKMRRKITCPFKIRANYSVRNDCWSLVVVNEYHDHEVDVPQKSSTKRKPKVATSTKLKKKREDAKKNTKVTKPEIDNNNKHQLDLLHFEKTEYDYELANTIGDKINELIKRQLSLNNYINEDSKANVIRLVMNNLVQEHNDTLKTPNSWLAQNATTNLIPLSPLLNDSDNEYVNPSANQTMLDSLTLPGISSNFLVNQTSGPTNPSTGLNNFALTNQLLQIQNQTQQLPSFNSIQNSLPLSPTSSSLPNPTLNPSNLIKSNNKNGLFNSNNLIHNNNLFNNILNYDPKLPLSNTHGSLSNLLSIPGLLSLKTFSSKDDRLRGESDNE